MSIGHFLGPLRVKNRAVKLDLSHHKDSAPRLGF